MSILLGSALLLLGAAAPVAAGSLKDIEHVVIFMQENRSWDNYFGTMAGVRGFADPNVQVNPDGMSVWHQKVTPELSNETSSLLPWHLGYGNWSDAVQCVTAGSNGYKQNQAALNGGLNDMWARNNTPWSWGYYKRSDIPVIFSIAEGWTSGDMYQESHITSTNPNRVALVSGTVNLPDSPYLDNNETPGCDEYGINCYPLKWKTIYELYEEAGVSWQFYQELNNYDDNPLAWFDQFQKQNASGDSPLAQKGLSYLGLGAFYEDAAAGTLPEISFVIAPAELSEHPPYMPKDGAWLQKKVVDAVTSSPKYSSTLLMISYDETGGFGDHVTPFHSPEDTRGEWMQDPYGFFDKIFVGPGFRVPFYIISPWTRGNRVFTERADHTSQILFLERWLEARGYNGDDIRIPEMVTWRREHMSDLVNALDLDHPDTSLPFIPPAQEPEMDGDAYVGAANCEASYETTRPPVPYGEQTEANSLVFEDGFKEVVGYLTEGRYLVFEQRGLALSNTRGLFRRKLALRRALEDHSDKQQRWVIHYAQDEDEESGIFQISSALDGKWMGVGDKIVSERKDAAKIRIMFLGNGKGYHMRYVADGRPLPAIGSEGYTVLSVTYH